jgi:hypothetical protein
MYTTFCWKGWREKPTRRPKRKWKDIRILNKYSLKVCLDLSRLRFPIMRGRFLYKWWKSLSSLATISFWKRPRSTPYAISNCLNISVGSPPHDMSVFCVTVCYWSDMNRGHESSCLLAVMDNEPTRPLCVTFREITLILLLCLQCQIWSRCLPELTKFIFIWRNNSYCRLASDTVRSGGWK